MRRLMMIALAAGIALFPVPQARAGKVESVKRAVREKCSQEIPIDILLDSVVRAYDCQPDQEIAIGGCKIKCLKGSSGNVVGQ